MASKPLKIKYLLARKTPRRSLPYARGRTIPGVLIRVLAAVFVVTAFPLAGQSFECEEELHLRPEMLELHRSPAAVDSEESEERHERLAAQHELEGTACYYADFFEGRRTANGEVFRQSRFTAAHQTLPLGTWVEVTSKSTGRTARVRINDRGPFSGGFILDLSRTAARFLGVDKARDRRVTIRVLALPGEPLPSEIDE